MKFWKETKAPACKCSDRKLIEQGWDNLLNMNICTVNTFNIGIKQSKELKNFQSLLRKENDNISQLTFIDKQLYFNQKLKSISTVANIQLEMGLYPMNPFERSKGLKNIESLNQELE